MNSEKLYIKNPRTEEVQHIIERMPTKFGLSVSIIVTFLFLSMLTFGWLIRYPDVVTGQVSINTPSSPIKLIANGSGKLKFNSVKSMGKVREGQIIAYIENPTNPDNVNFIDSLLMLYDPNKSDIRELIKKIPNNLSLGELNPKYFAFTKALQEYINYKQDKLMDKQRVNYNELLKEQEEGILTASKRIEMSKNTISLMHKFYSRDSILFIKKVISESEFDKTQMSYLSSKDAMQNAVNNHIMARQTAQQTQSKLQELDIEKPEKEKELRNALCASYNDLIDNIKLWEQKYVFRSPFNGRVQFLKFYSENHFIQAGEQVFTVIPNENKILGQVILSNKGIGKIKTGQEVIVKLDNYPYNEYGSITGVVKSISLTSSIAKSEKEDVDTYMVNVDFPNQLKTNYGTSLDFKAEAKGSAEIITTDRRLIQRLFDNIKSHLYTCLYQMNFPETVLLFEVLFPYKNKE